MSEKTYKSRCVEKFAPNKKYRDSWDRIFSKDKIEPLKEGDRVILEEAGGDKSIRVVSKIMPSPGSEDAQELGSPQHK